MAANTAIALAKLAGFAITGSASMLGEAVHSVADASNQGLLYVGHRRGQSKTWSMVAAVILLMLASLTVYEGIEKILHPEPVKHALVVFAILGVSITLEGFSLITAIKAMRGSKLTPELLVIMCEDSADLIGLGVAIVAVALAEITGRPVWDGIGTLAIGTILAGVAALLIHQLRGQVDSQS